MRSGRIGLQNNLLRNIQPNGYGFFTALCDDRGNTGHRIEPSITNSPSKTISSNHSLLPKLVIQMVKAVASYA